MSDSKLLTMDNLNKLLESDPFFDSLEKVFGASTHDILNESRPFSIDSHWIIASDYSIRDPNKKNSVYCFAAIPFLGDIGPLKAHIDSIAPNDFKNIKRLSPMFAEYIANSPIIFFCFMLA